MDRGNADGCHVREAEVKERDGRAFAEVQRADTKATTLCRVAGGLLALTATALSQQADTPGVSVVMLSAGCLLLVSAVGVALLALRPVLPGGGLTTELARSLCGQCDGDRSPGCSPMAAACRGGGELRLGVLAGLADRKLRLVRLAGDLILAALPLAGIGLLSGYAFN
ncbi:hypothetical protein [Streptomyces sp. NPDC058305]|uniref:hypothetical protein n=1 Tax=Streptomyces sp. NPDC058305 TaxID=3346438 RepID=UPI0036EF6811